LGLECIVDVIEGDRVADDHRILLPVVGQVFGDFEDLVGVAHRSDDGDLVAHQVEEIHRHGLLVHRDDPEPCTRLGGRQRRLDDRGRSGGVEEMTLGFGGSITVVSPGAVTTDTFICLPLYAGSWL